MGEEEGRWWEGKGDEWMNPVHCEIREYAADDEGVTVRMSHCC